VLNLAEAASTLYAGIGGTGGQVMAWNLTGKSL
jgi:hypothetical protein